MHTPQEAVAELEHCKSLGIKAAALGSLIRRPIPAAAEQGISRRYAFWCDVLALDSAYNYDPVWRACVELGYPATFHSAAEDFQAFTFGNAVKLWGSLNPDFFKGTAVESQARQLQAQSR